MRRAVSGLVLTVTTLIGLAAGYGIGTHGTPDAPPLPARRPEVKGARVTRATNPLAIDLPVTSTAPEPPAVAAAAPTAPRPRVERAVVPPTTFRGTAAKPAPPPRKLTAASQKEAGVWAVVIGIDDYPGTENDLKAGVADARDVDQALAGYGVPASHRVLLTNGQASAQTIRDAAGWLVNHASADATAVFFYSGHVRQVGGDRDHDGEVEDEAIVGADGVDVLDGTLARDLEGLEARRTWLGIAGCYGAGFDDLLAPGRVLTAATGENQLAFENEGFGRSYLVEYMVRRAMLQGKAPDSVQQSFEYARKEISRDYPDRVPVMIDRAGAPVPLRQPPSNGTSSSNPPSSQPTTTTRKCSSGIISFNC